MTLGFSDRLMLHPFGHYIHFTFVQRGYPISKMEIEMTLQDNEDIIRLRMVVPDELSLHFHDLEMIIVQLGNDLRGPVLREFFQFFFEIDGLIFHVIHSPHHRTVRHAFRSVGYYVSSWSFRQLSPCHTPS